ncbi:MAG: hypothetical protein M3O30_18755 [Planctomycetota bacterium]|nr:hypothetical protein [Planctomycetota bacterium]
MKRKPSISNEEAVVRHLREDRDFATTYLKAAIKATGELNVLPRALQRLDEATTMLPHHGSACPR